MWMSVRKALTIFAMKILEFVIILLGLMNVIAQQDFSEMDIIVWKMKLYQTAQVWES